MMKNMMYDTLIAKHYKNSWESRIYVERVDDMMLLTDSDVIVKVAPDFKLFNDRSMFPELPGEGECFTYSKTAGMAKKGVESAKLINHLLGGGIEKVTITPWIIKGSAITYIRLGYVKQTSVLIEQKYFDWFCLEPENVFSDVAQQKPVIFTELSISERPTTIQDVKLVAAQYSLKKLDASCKFPAVNFFNNDAIDRRAHNAYCRECRYNGQKGIGQ
jgi:hypothetical protein